MQYISAKEAAEKWGVHVRLIQRYCRDCRISGAKRHGRAWLIPFNAQKPYDLRREQKEYSCFCTLPRHCPELISTTLYHTPGTADNVVGQLSFDPDAAELFRMQLTHMRGDIDSAKLMARELLEATDRPDVILGCAGVLCLGAMYNGDSAGWLEARSRVAALRASESSDKALRDFYLGYLDSALYDKNTFPEWFKEGDFSVLPPDCYPLARFLYLKWLMLSKIYHGSAVISGVLLSQSRMEGALVSEIYITLASAVAHHDSGAHKKACELVDIAVRKALPDRLYTPLTEARAELGVLMDERLLLVDKNAAADVRRLSKQLAAGWAKLCKNVRGITYITTMTQREHHAAKLAARGMSNAEIASQMKISINTVKHYISEAIAKTGVANRNELAEFLSLEGKGTP